MPQLFYQQGGCIAVKTLVDSRHNAHLHQRLDQFGALDRHLLRQFGNSDGFRNFNFVDDGFGRHFETMFT